MPTVGYSHFSKFGRTEVAVHRFADANKAMIGVATFEQSGDRVGVITGDFELMREGVKAHGSPALLQAVEAAIANYGKERPDATKKAPAQTPGLAGNVGGEQRQLPGGGNPRIDPNGTGENIGA